jgi:TRAP-type C4-dicarboxylate transport system substrate-binding protein
VMGGFLVCGLGNSLVYGAEKPYELKFYSPYYEPHLMYKYNYKPWMDKVTEMSGGKVKIVFYPPNSIVKLAEVYDAAKSGLVDIGGALCGEMRGKFPLTELMEMPLLFSSATAGSLTLWNLYNKYPEFKEEYKDVKVMWLWLSAIQQVLTSKKQVKTLEDLKGLKLAAQSKALLDTIKALGALPVHVSPPEVYMAMDRGVVDGCLMPFVGAKGIKVFEAAKFAAKADIMSISFFMVMSPKKYNELPPDVKKILDETTFGRQAEASGAALDRGDAEAMMQVQKEDGVTVYELPAQERERWIKAVMPVRESMLKDVEAKGYKNAKEIVNDATKLADQYKKK